MPGRIAELAVIDGIGRQIERADVVVDESAERGPVFQDCCSSVWLPPATGALVLSSVGAPVALVIVVLLGFFGVAVMVNCVPALVGAATLLVSA